MPFGLTNAPATFQRLMNYVLHDYLNDFVVVYLDDILVCSDTFDEHINHLRKVFTKLREANLMIKLKKILTEAPVLLFLNFDKPFNLCTDASLKGLGAVLEQENENGNLRPVAYASRSLTPAEKNYHTTDLECLAII